MNQELLAELQTILEEDYRIDIRPEDVAVLADDLIQYFSLLTKIERKHEDETI